MGHRGLDAPLNPRHGSGRCSGWRFAIAGLFSLVVLTACAGEDEAAPTATPAPTSVSTAVPTIASENIGEVQWAGSVEEDGEPADTLSTLNADADVVYAVLPVTDLSHGTTVSAVWSTNGEPVDELNQSIDLAEDVPEGWIAFSLDWNASAPWPTGTLAIEIAANGDPVASAEIEIVTSSGE